MALYIQMMRKFFIASAITFCILNPLLFSTPNGKSPVRCYGGTFAFDHPGPGGSVAKTVYFCLAKRFTVGVTDGNNISGTMGCGDVWADDWNPPAGGFEGFWSGQYPVSTGGCGNPTIAPAPSPNETASIDPLHQIVAAK